MGEVLSTNADLPRSLRN